MGKHFGDAQKPPKPTGAGKQSLNKKTSIEPAEWVSVSGILTGHTKCWVRQVTLVDATNRGESEAARDLESLRAESSERDH